MKKIPIISFGLMALTLLISNSVFAYQGDPAIQGPNYSEERHNSMVEAFKNKDYEAWKDIMSERGRSRVVEVITEENFETFVQMHNLMIEGDTEKAQELRQELGLGQRNMNKGGNGPMDGSWCRRNK